MKPGLCLFVALGLVLVLSTEAFPTDSRDTDAWLEVSEESMTTDVEGQSTKQSQTSGGTWRPAEVGRPATLDSPRARTIIQGDTGSFYPAHNALT